MRKISRGEIAASGIGSRDDILRADDELARRPGLLDRRLLEGRGEGRQHDDHQQHTADPNLFSHSKSPFFECLQAGRFRYKEP